MLWSKPNLGEYIGGGPRAVGTLCACAWLLSLALVQRLGCLSTQGTMLLCIGGNVVVGLAWFGAGILARNSGWHSYGIGTYWPLAVLLVLHLIFLVAGVARKPETAET
jgi:hypothetical protein